MFKKRRACLRRPLIRDVDFTAGKVDSGAAKKGLVFYMLVNLKFRIPKGVTLALAVAALLSLSANLAAQNKQRRGARKPIANARFTNGQPAVNIPFDFEYRQIVISASINHSAPMRFLFDTGAGATILNKSRTAGLKLKKIDTVKVNGVMAGILAGGVSLSVPGVTVRNQRVW